MMMENSSHVGRYPGMRISGQRVRYLDGVLFPDCPGSIGQTWESSYGITCTRGIESCLRKIDEYIKLVLYSLASYAFRLLPYFQRVMGRNSIFAATAIITDYDYRRGFVATGLLLLSASVTAAPPPSSATFTYRPDSSLSDYPLRLSENLSLGTSHTGNALSAGAERSVGGRNDISRIAKAYLDYTFFNRQTGNLRQNFQGRLGITNKTTTADYRVMPQFSSGVIQDSPLPSLERFRFQTNALNIGGNNAAEYQENSSFQASLEWRLKAPGFADKSAFDNLTWGDILQVSFFADYGKEFSHSATSIDTPKRELAGIGTGLRFSLPGRFTANLQAAYSLNDWERDRIGMNGGNSDSNRTQYMTSSVLMSSGTMD